MTNKQTNSDLEFYVFYLALQQLRFVDKMIAKNHASILSLQNLLGEAEAQEIYQKTTKPSVSALRFVTTPVKKPSEKKKVY